jgi:uncharacterized SAM-binding protein YcdF (DUF218 family)
MSLYDLEKTFAMLCMPLGLLWLLLLATAYVLLRRRQWGPAAAVLTVWVLLAFAGNYYVGSALLGRLERAIPPVDLPSVKPFDAVFVLGGGTEVDPGGDPILGNAGDRVITAARLYHAGKARHLVASGVSRDAVGGIRDGGLETRAIWLALGIPDEAILVVPTPCWITREEITAYRQLATDRHWKRMALVSSAYHLPRAMGLAEKAGLTFTPIGSDWKGRAYALQLQRFVPQGSGLERTSNACWEYLGRWVGR